MFSWLQAWINFFLNKKLNFSFEKRDPPIITFFEKKESLTVNTKTRVSVIRIIFWIFPNHHLLNAIGQFRGYYPYKEFLLCLSAIV